MMRPSFLPQRLLGFCVCHNAPLDRQSRHLHRLIDENATIAAARKRIETDVAGGKLSPLKPQRRSSM